MRLTSTAWLWSHVYRYFHRLFVRSRTEGQLELNIDCPLDLVWSKEGVMRRAAVTQYYAGWIHSSGGKRRGYHGILRRLDRCVEFHALPRGYRRYGGSRNRVDVDDQLLTHIGALIRR